MWHRSLLSRRRVLLTSGVVSGILVLSACDKPPTFAHEPLNSGSAPVRMQRLLLWLPPNDDFIDGKYITSEFVRLLAPFDIVVEAGRASRVELYRGTEQSEIVQRFNPTYTLEIDVARGSGGNSPSLLVRAALYRGGGSKPLEKFHHHAQSKDPRRFVQQIVESLKAGGYL